MKLKQLSVFLENKPGQIVLPIEALARAGISIKTLCLADTQQFGIMRMIIEEHQRAKEVLTEAGFTVNECEVLAIEVPDRAGGLAELLASFSNEGLNLEYMYAFSCGSAGKALLVFRFDDPDRAVVVLTQKGINVIGRKAVFEQTGS